MKLLTVVALICFATPALADGGPDFFKLRNVKHGDELKIREEPTVDSLWLDGIDPGTSKIKNLGCLTGREIWTYLKNDTLKPTKFNGQTWCKVSVPTSGNIGWANAAFLSEDQ